jgi:hypothetical protein
MATPFDHELPAQPPHRPIVPPPTPPAATPLSPHAPRDAGSVAASGRIPQPRAKHPAHRARLVVAGAAAAATVGLVGGLAIAAPATAPAAQVPADSNLPGAGGVSPTAPSTTTPSTVAGRSSGRSGASPSTTTPSASTPSTRIAPATPSQRTPAQPQTRSRAS